MTVGIRNRTPEERAIGLLFKENFQSRVRVEQGGATLVGTGTTFSKDGVTFDGNGNLSYAVSGVKLFRPTLTIVIEFTLGFAGNDGVEHYFFRASAGSSYHFSILKTSTNALAVYCNGSFPIFVAYATWSAALVVGKNTLVVSSTSGASSAWLNGILISSSVGAWTAQFSSTVLAIGASAANTSRFVGTIHRLEIYGNVATAVDEPYLRNGNLITKLDDYLLCLPGGPIYARSSDGLYVAPALGKAGVREVLAGSDGITTAQFPSIVKPRGYSFDGGDQFNCGDNDLFSFTTGASDKPFSLFYLASQVAGATAFLIGKATASNNGEYILALSLVGSNVRVYFLQIDETAVAWIGRYGSLSLQDFLRARAIIATADGTGVAGMRIYVDGTRIDTANSTSGSYVRMRNTDKPLRIGGGNAGYTALNGNETLSGVCDYEISPLQTKALTARLKWQARVPA